MMNETIGSMILKPLSVLGEAVTSRDLAAVVDGMANVPARFIAMDVLGPLPDHGAHWKQEVANRLLQRWRKLGLASFKGGRWSLTPGAWSKMQSAVSAFTLATPSIESEIAVLEQGRVG